jgi:hypothetical protein
MDEADILAGEIFVLFLKDKFIAKREVDIDRLNP